MDDRLVPVLLGALVLVSLAGPAAGTQSCDPNGDAHVCLSEVGLSEETLSTNEDGRLQFTVTNHGDEPVTVRLVLVVAGPNNDTQSVELDRDAGQRTVEPGESVTFEQRLNPETPGTHGLQLRLFGEDRSTRYDTSNALTVTVREPSPGLGGPIDRAELALGALIGALGVMGYVVRRN